MEHLTAWPLGIHQCSDSRDDEEPLIVLRLRLGDPGKGISALVDTGATNNFVRAKTLEEIPPQCWKEKKLPPSMLNVRLADGTIVRERKRVVRIRYAHKGKKHHDDFVVLKLDDRFDVILGMPWLASNSPTIDWRTRSVTVNTLGDASQRIDSGNVAPDESNVGEDDAGSPPHHRAISSTKGDEGKVARLQQRVAQDTQNETRSKKMNPHACTDMRSSTECAPPNTLKPSAARRQKRKAMKVEGAKPSPPMIEPASPIMMSQNDSADENISRVESGTPAQTVRVESYTLCSVIVNTGSQVGITELELENPPPGVEGLTALPGLSLKKFMKELRAGKITQLCMLTVEGEHGSLESLAATAATTSSMDEEVLDDRTRIERYQAQSWESLKTSPFYKDILEYKDIFPEELPCELPKDKGIQHEIDLVPGTKYCVTRQWPLPREQVEAIDAFFAERHQAGHVRESKSPHCSPTFCVKKATGGWRIVHAFNKLNAATIPAQTPIPRKDVIIDGMCGSTIFSAVDLTDGFYQILMRLKDIPLTAVSTPSGMLWEWLVMPQGLSNAPATFNRCVTHLLRPVRDFAPSYFDDVYIHSRAEGSASDVEVHRKHLRAVFALMREHKLYARLQKCIFGASEIPVLGCFVGKNGVRPDPEKIRAIKEWPTPSDVKELRKFLGLATYLHKYAKNYAEMSLPLSHLLKKDVEWDWSPECDQAFNAIRQSLMTAPVLAIADTSKPFYVVCDASDFAIGCALMQRDQDDAERVVCYHSRQLKPAEKNYPVHDKELLAMKFALAKCRVYLLGSKPFVVYTDHASLRTAVNSPHLSQRMARWLSFFAEFNFTVEYKPGRFNVIADALSRRPDYAPPQQEAVASMSASTPTASLHDDIRRAYKHDDEASAIIKYFADSSAKALAALPARLRASVHRYAYDDGLLRYRVHTDDAFRIVVPNDEDLRLRILYEYHDSPVSGHRGREKTYAALSRDFYWRRAYAAVRRYVRACEVCQRAKPYPVCDAPLHPLPVPAECWQSVSMDFVFGLPKDKDGNTGILVFVDRLSKMVHLAAVPDSITADGSARLFVDTVFRLHGMPIDIVSDRDPRFTAEFWQSVFRRVGTQLSMSTADHPQTDGQTERANRVLEEILRSYVHSFESWSEFLPMAEFAINNSVHASTGHTPFYVNGLRHPRLPPLLGVNPNLTGGGLPHAVAHDMAVDTSDGEDHHRSTPTAPEQRNRAPPAVDPSPDSTLSDSGGISGTSTVPLTGNTGEPMDIDESANTARVAERRAARQADQFLVDREAIIRFVQDAIGQAVDRQKMNADRQGRKNQHVFNVGDLVLLSTKSLPEHAVSCVGSSKLLPRFIGPFKVLRRQGEAYTLDLPSAMRTHPTFYVGRLRPYCDRSAGDESQRVATPLEGPCSPSDERQDPLHGQGDRRSRLPSFGSSPSSRRPPSRGRRHDSEMPAQPATGSDDSQGSTPGLAKPVEPACLREKANESARANVRVRATVRAKANGAAGANDAVMANDGETPRVSSRGQVFPPPPPPLRDADGESRWIVEAILSHKGKSQKGQRRYLIRWRGYPPSHDSWEPRDALLEDVPDLVSDYDRAHRL